MRNHLLKQSVGCLKIMMHMRGMEGGVGPCKVTRMTISLPEILFIISMNPLVVYLQLAYNRFAPNSHLCSLLKGYKIFDSLVSE